MSAIAYAQIREGYGCCYVTTGCGGTNTITGVLHAWQDHVPVVFVSGQCNRNEMMTIAKSKVRQIGLQEADIVSIVDSITKYAVTIMEPADAVYCIEKALYEAQHGNPGPVWLDIPMDIQEAEIDPNKLKHFVPEQKIKTECTEDEISYVIRALEEAERPIIIVGQGVRLAGACKELSEFIDKYQIPMEKLCNLPHRHEGYKSKTFAVPIEGEWFGITMAFITHSKYESKPFDQRMTPYTEEGRRIYSYYRSKK